MMAKIYNQKGEEVGQTTLPKGIFGVKINADLLYQVAVSQMSNRRQKVAHAKDRSEVSGGGKKPWRQKGTGRARHGSIRSPLWKGGGVTFGPNAERNYKKQIPQKMRKKALLMVLSSKANENDIVILEEMSLEKPKTKIANEVLNNLKKADVLKKGSILIALSDKSENIIQAFRNIPNVQIRLIKDLNVLDLLSFKYLMISKAAISAFKEKFLKKNADNDEQA